MDAQDVAVGIAKPGLAKVSSGRDAVLGVDLREVLLFEAHAAVAQLFDGGSHVALHPTTGECAARHLQWAALRPRVAYCRRIDRSLAHQAWVHLRRRGLVSRRRTLWRVRGRWATMAITAASVSIVSIDRIDRCHQPFVNARLLQALSFVRFVLPSRRCSENRSRPPA